MKLSNIKSVLPLANKLQSMYNGINVPFTQNIRNPLPMRCLVEMVLPIIPEETSWTVEGIPIKVELFGKTTQVTPVAHFSTSDVLGKDYIANSALSVEDIIAKLKHEKWIVNSRQAVITALCNNPKIKSIPAPLQYVEERIDLMKDYGAKYLKKDGTKAKPLGCFNHKLYYIPQSI